MQTNFKVSLVKDTPHLANPTSQVRRDIEAGEAQMVWVLPPAVALISVSVLVLMNGVKHNHSILHPRSATIGVSTAQDKHPNCSRQLASAIGSSSNTYQSFPGCFLLLCFAPSFQAFVLERQRRLHSSLRQVSDGDGDGDADGDRDVDGDTDGVADGDVDGDADEDAGGWHQQSDCSLLPSQSFSTPLSCLDGAVNSPRAEVPQPLRYTSNPD